MNIGPNTHSSLIEMVLAIFFVLLVFAMFVFAFGAPIVSYLVTVKERWPEYSKRKRVRTLSTAAATIGLFVLLVVWATSPFHNA